MILVLVFILVFINFHIISSIILDSMADFVVPVRSHNLDSRQRLAGPIHQERHVKIICIGAGASGLLIAYKLQKHFQNFSLVVYEKNKEVSGTWFENRYPGYVSPHKLHVHKMTCQIMETDF